MMAPRILGHSRYATREIIKPTEPDTLVLEAWSEGFMVGALIIMICITVANMRQGVWLHKLVLAEVRPSAISRPPFAFRARASALTGRHDEKLVLSLWHGTFIFNQPPIYGWYLSTTAVGLNVAYSLHNVIAWMKIKPFLSPRVSRIYISTVIVAQPYWVLEIYANFAYFNNINTIFLHTRPWEALFRDPWWILTTTCVFWNIKSRYEFGFLEILRTSPRFAIMLMAMCLSICFLLADILTVTNVIKVTISGINPFWKFSFVFKCLTDSVILDDFKTALDRLREFKLQQIARLENGGSVGSNRLSQPDHILFQHGDQAKATSHHLDLGPNHHLEDGVGQQQILARNHGRV